MKTSILIIIGVIFIQGNIFGGFTTEPLEVQLLALEEPIGVNFHIKSTLPNALVVTIRNRNREILFQQSYTGSVSYKGTVNLEQLADGIYYFEVRQGTNIYKEEIYLQEQTSRHVMLKH